MQCIKSAKDISDSMRFKELYAWLRSHTIIVTGQDLTCLGGGSFFFQLRFCRRNRKLLNYEVAECMIHSS